MSEYYNPKRTRNIFVPGSGQPFLLSRSKIDLFLECARCFYFDRRLGISRPPGFPFSLNAAVDTLLKKEFDVHRAKKSSHPLMHAYGIDAIPFDHPDITTWRDALRGGIKYLHHQTNLLISGGIDDVWVNPKGELLIVDYKATAKGGEITLDADWQIGYKRQVEVYQWLFRHNGFGVSTTAYFVYCNGDLDKKAFDGKLEFKITIIPYEGNDGWIEATLKEIRQCLEESTVPAYNKDCDYCRYREAVKEYEQPAPPLSLITQSS